MQGDGLSFPVNPAAGGEFASHAWAGAVGPREEGRGSGSSSSGSAGGEERIRHVRSQDDGDMV